MIYALKATGAVLFVHVFDPALLNLFDPVFDQTSAILDVVAIAAIFGSVMTYNRIKAALTASESTGKAWREERDAALAHVGRIEKDMAIAQEEKVSLVAKLTALEQRPDLTRLQELVAEATAATKNHEVAAGARTERLITAVESLGAGQRETVAAVEQLAVGQREAAATLKEAP